MSRRILLSILICISVMPASAQKFKVGDKVHNTVSGFNGTVVETGGIDGYVKVSLDGSSQDVASWMNPKWLTSPGMPVPQTPAKAGGQAGGGNFTLGSKVEFDRAEGSQPQFGRWDSGTVVGKDQRGRVLIKSATNGTTYPIQDNPRWILPGGSAVPGPRHDAYNQAPPPAPNQAANPNRNPAPNNGGGRNAGPFSGEWTAISVDGQRYEPGAQNFNFVGNRYEILNQGSTMSGHFSVSGNSVQMISDDGSPFATFQYSMQGGQMVLKTPGTEYILIPAHK